MEDEDAAVVRQCQKGDVDAFEVLVERYQEKMFTTAYRMLGDYDDACEVVQETFLSAYRSIRDFRSESRFSTWLFSIVINQTRNRLKKRQARARREVLSLDDPDGPGEGAGLHLPAESVLDRLDQNTRGRKGQGVHRRPGRRAPGGAGAPRYRRVLVRGDREHPGASGWNDQNEAVQGQERPEEPPRKGVR